MLCAGAPGKDSCQVPGLKLLHQIPTRYQPDQSFQGDSGGPFTVKSEETNQHDLVGVVSWGDGCAAVKYALWAAYGHFWTILLKAAVIGQKHFSTSKDN